MIFSPISQINNLTEKQTQKEITPQEFCFSSSFKAPRLINFSHHLHFLIKKIFRTHAGYKGEVILISENGRPIEIMEQLRPLFDDQLAKSQTIDYCLKFQKQYFHLVLTLGLDVEGQVPAIKKPDFEEVVSMMKTIENLLFLSGVLKTKNRLSLKTLKMELELKKNVAESLSPSQKNRSLEPIEILPEKKLIQRLKIQELSTIQQKQKKGGSFLVQKKLCKLTKQDGSTLQLVLAKKRARSSKEQQKKRKAKLGRELAFIQQIHNDQYFLKYYLAAEDSSCFYLDYIPKSLKDIIYDRSVRVDERFLLASQLIQAVSILHASNIVHRDLKPENILVQTVDLNKKLKIIDFGESSLIEGANNSEFSLGSSPPYSPIQCLLDIETESYHQPEIDLWSVIMIIYELIFRSLPIYYNRSIQLEIVHGWRTEGDFSVILCHRKKSGFHKILQTINLLVEQGLRINQKERVCLSSMKSFVKAIKNFHQNLNGLHKQL